MKLRKQLSRYFVNGCLEVVENLQENSLFSWNACFAKVNKFRVTAVLKSPGLSWKVNLSEKFVISSVYHHIITFYSLKMHYVSKSNFNRICLLTVNVLT